MLNGPRVEEIGSSNTRTRPSVIVLYLCLLFSPEIGPSGEKKEVRKETHEGKESTRSICVI